MTLHPLAIFGGLFTLLGAAILPEGWPLLIVGVILGVLGTTQPCDEVDPPPYRHPTDDNDG